MKKANIILFMCDQYRYDAFSFKDHPDVKTPHLDTLANEGTSFDHAYSSCPSCIPARAALFTGKSQRHHGRVGYEDGISWDYEHMLAQELSNHGYQTQCIGKMHVHPSRNRCGFQNVKLHDGYLGYYRNQEIPHMMHQDVTDDYLHFLKQQKGVNADITNTVADCNSWVTHPWIYEEYLHPTNWVSDESIRFLQTRDRDKPFFLMTSYVRPHQPLDAPASYFDMYKDKQLTEPAQGDWNDVERHLQFSHEKDSIFGCYDESMRHDAMAGYYACITHVDHQIGRVIQSLKEDGCYEDSILLFLSDHGEMLFDHKLYRKVFGYEGSAHIPVLIRIGKNIAKTKKQRSDTLIELRDILPTILDFADVPIPDDVDGFSLVPELFGKIANKREYIHGEHSFHSQLSSQFIITEHDKYIWYSETGIEQYFDLAKDPKETHNAINDEIYQERIAYLRKCLIMELAGREEGYSDGHSLITGRTPLHQLHNI